MSLKSLLENPTTSIEPPKEIPAGQYRAQIIAADILPFIWQKSGRFGKGVAPVIQLLEPILTGDPEIDNEWQAKLDAYGDWRSKQLSWTIPAKESENRPKQMAISAINFSLIKCDPELNDVDYDDGLWRFYLSADKSKTGEEAGFAVDVLGLTGTNKSILDLINEMEGRELIVDLQFDSPEPPYSPRLQCVGAQAA
jgi:hypothetical protein